MEKRQDVLRDCERKKRKYVKQDDEFWKEGRREVMRKLPRISTEPCETGTQPPCSPFTREELKKKTVAQLREMLQTLAGVAVSPKERKAVIIEKVLELID